MCSVMQGRSTLPRERQGREKLSRVPLTSGVQLQHFLLKQFREDTLRFAFD
uniref:Uncharacterized protein n=2 Tax=Anguilla anguilla TaxID=7936 RepID=A0A0E9S4Z9_ANGAN